MSLSMYVWLYTCLYPSSAQFWSEVTRRASHYDKVWAYFDLYSLILSRKSCWIGSATDPPFCANTDVTPKLRRATCITCLPTRLSLLTGFIWNIHNKMIFSDKEYLLFSVFLLIYLQRKILSVCDLFFSTESFYHLFRVGLPADYSNHNPFSGESIYVGLNH